jgi:branched-chain amino acid transport system permease protein
MLRLDRAEERSLMREAEASSCASAWASRCTSSPATSRSAAAADGDRPRALCRPDPAAARRAAAGLRHQEKQGLAKVLRQLRDEGLSILLVEHDMDLVMGLVDRVVVMEFGTKLIEGTPEEVQASPAVRAAYLGTEH